jgi:hypothetical protein
LEEFKVLLLDHSAGIFGQTSVGKGGRLIVIVELFGVLLKVKLWALID